MVKTTKMSGNGKIILKFVDKFAFLIYNNSVESG